MKKSVFTFLILSVFILLIFSNVSFAQNYPSRRCVLENHYCMKADGRYPNTLQFTSWSVFRWIAGGNNKSEQMKLESGRLTASSFDQWSDISLKTNVNDLSDPLHLVTSLHGVKYQDKNSNSTTKTIGLIAQEVEKIVPEVVNTNDNGLKSVDYTALIPLLIESIKVQQKTIEDLQREVEISKNL